MSKLNFTLLAAVYLLLLSHCNLDIEKNINLEKSDFFFSTEKYFNEEAKRLKTRKGFTKSVTFNGAQEKVKMDTLNFQQEFLPFIKADINKFIWYDQYACDTTYLNKTQILSINCTSLSPKLKTRTLLVEYEDNEIVSINIECDMHKMLLDTREYLTYKRDSYYEIKRIQALKTGTLDSTLVRVDF